MTPALADAIENAYRVFAPYTIGSALIVCHCPSCMTEEMERKLVETPLRSVLSEHLAEYTNSAHPYEEQVARELRYFLPRYFELIAKNDPPDNMGLDTCLRRLADTGWRTAWSAAQVEAIDRWLDALIQDVVHRLDCYIDSGTLAFDIKDILTMAVTAGADIERMLRAWEAAEDPAAVVHMASARMSLNRRDGRVFLESVYLEDHETAAEKIGAFLTRPETEARIESAFFNTEDKQLQRILSDGV